MRPLKLYVKTTLLASAVTVLVLAVAWALIGVRVARVVQEKEKNLARVQAASLAEHFMAWGVPHNTPAWQTAVQRALYNNPGLAAVRVWERADEKNYRPFAATDDVTKAPILLASVRAELARNHAAEYFAAQLEGVEGARFYAYAPLHNEFGQVEGAVEIIQRLDSPASLAWSYAQSEAWLALAAVILITIGTYALYRSP